MGGGLSIIPDGPRLSNVHLHRLEAARVRVAPRERRLARPRVGPHLRARAREPRDEPRARRRLRGERVQQRAPQHVTVAARAAAARVRRRRA